MTNEINNDNYLYQKYKKIILKAIKLGQKGELTITPKTLWIGATNNCNIRCIMCFFEKKNTYINTNDLKMLLSKDKKTKYNFGKIKAIDLTAGESLINPEIYQITKLLKNNFPDSEISIITNATLPIKGDIKKALQLIDRIGISIDGVNQKTYEYIRRGANFFNVIKNTQDIVKLKEKSKNKLCLLFCAMTININELPKWVKLAYFLDIKYLFIQKAEVREKINFDISNYDLSSLKNEEIQKIIDETQKEANKLDRYITLTDITKNNIEENTKKEKLMRMCSVVWNTSPWLFKNEKEIYPGTVCCHMINDKHSVLSQKKELQNKSIEKIFNSKDYWKIRKNIISGKFTQTVCSKCQYYKMTQWTEDELEQLKKKTR